MAKVNSTAIRSVKFRFGRGVDIEFHNGGRYRYEAPMWVALMLRNSRSVGRDYNEFVKGHFNTEKLR